MAEARKFITDFTGGEVTDRLLARIDRAIYQRTCRLMENFILHPAGGADFRPGTYYCGGAKTNTGIVRFIPFVRSATESYVLELSNLLIRIWKDGALVQAGGATLEVATPWAEADLFALKYHPGKDCMYFTHPSYQTCGLYYSTLNGWSFSDADYLIFLAVGCSAGGYLDLFTYDNDNFEYKSYNPDTKDNSQHNYFCFSADDKYLAAAHVGGVFAHIYKRAFYGNKNAWTAIYPDAYPTGVAHGCAFSPDMVHLMYAHEVSPYITIYKRNGDTFAKQGNPVSLPTANGNACDVSPDGVYWAVATANELRVYKRSGDTFTYLTQIQAVATLDCKFSPCGNYLAAGMPASPYIKVWRRTGDNFVALSNPSTLPAGQVNRVAFSRGGFFLAAACSLSPYVYIYKRISETFLKLDNPATLPAGAATGCSFSMWDDYLIVSHTTTPFITIYSKVGDAFTKIANPPTLPTGNGTACTFANTGWAGLRWGKKYPAAVTMHEQRLLVATDEVNYSSKIARPQDFSQNPADASYGYEYSFADGVLWLASKDHNIIIGAKQSEWLMTGGEQPITAANVYVDQVSAYGSADLAAVLANESLLFVQKGGQRLREFMYSQERGGYISPDLTQLADHIGEPGFVQLAWQRSPRSQLWAIRGNGELANLTLDRNSNIVAWQRQPTDGMIESAAVIPGTNEDIVYLLAKRTINGNQKKYVEYLKPINRPSDERDYFFVDCGKTFDYSATHGHITAAASYPLMDHGDCESADLPHVQDDAATLLGCTFDRSMERVYEGTYARKLVKTTAVGSYGIVQFVDNTLTTDLHGFVPGRKYKITLKLNVPSAGGPSSLSEVILQFGYYVSGGWTILSASAPTAYDAWQTMSVETTIPATATAATCSFRLAQATSTGEYVYADQIKVRSPVQITSATHPFVNDDVVRITDVGGMTELNGNCYMVKNKTANNLELYLTDGVTFMDGAEVGAYTSGGLCEKAVKVLTGLDHLEAKSVAIYADAKVLANEVVAGGSITIDEYATKIQVGLPYTGKIYTQRMGAFLPVVVPEGVLLLYKSHGGKIGPDAAHLENIRYESDTLLTGPREVQIGGRFSREGSIMIVQDKPLPMTVLGIMANMSIGE